MKTEQIIVTHGSIVNSIYIGVVVGIDKDRNIGYIVYGFEENKPEPKDISLGKLLISKLFTTEAEALKAGAKIVIANNNIKSRYSN